MTHCNRHQKQLLSLHCVRLDLGSTCCEGYTQSRSRFLWRRTRCANIFLLARNDIHNFYLLSLCILRSFILITQRCSSFPRYSFCLFLSQHRSTFRILNEISRRHICNSVAGGVKSCGPQKILYCVRKQARGDSKEHGEGCPRNGQFNLKVSLIPCSS